MKITRQTLVLSAIALAAHFATAAETVNLLANPGLETGDLSGWETLNGYVYANTGLTHSGNYFMQMEPYSIWDEEWMFFFENPAEIRTIVDLTPWAAMIDASNVVLRCGGYFCQCMAQQLCIWVYLLDAKGLWLGYSDFDTSRDGSLDMNDYTLVALTNAVPAGTRRFEMVYHATAWPNGGISPMRGDDFFVHLSCPPACSAISLEEGTCVRLAVTNLLNLASYRICAATSLVDAAWEPVTNFNASGTHREVDLPSAGFGQRFFKIEGVPVP